MTTLELIEKTKAAWGSLRDTDTDARNQILTEMAACLEADSAAILEQNRADMADARGHISDVMLDRLRLDEGRIAAMAAGIRAAAALPDHVGRILSEFHHANGMTIYKKQVPLGLVAIIYESRPNVTSDAAALCVKSGNVCVLRSGREAIRTSTAIVAALKRGIRQAGANPDIVNILEDTSHESANVLMTADGLVDLLIPRGGAGLIRACVEHATVPCIQTGTGICHVYVDEYADLDMALKIIVNAKTSRPSVCNAEEVCLVHSAVAERFLPMLHAALTGSVQVSGQVSSPVPVELRLDEAGSGHHPRNAGGAHGFRHGISGLHFSGEGGGQRGRGGGPHPEALHPPQRGHHYGKRGKRGTLCQRDGQCGGICQRLHPLYRRRGVRSRLRDGDFHTEAPRPGPYGAG